MNDDYDVGYKRPPKHTQFKKGQSGNYKGRPQKKHKDLTELICEELEEEILVNENGVSKKVTKLEALAKSIVSGAIKLKNNPLDAVFRATEETVEHRFFNDVHIYIPDNGRQPEQTKEIFKEQEAQGITDAEGRLLDPFEDEQF